MEKHTKKRRLHEFYSINQQPIHTMGRGSKNLKCLPVDMDVPLIPRDMAMKEY